MAMFEIFHSVIYPCAQVLEIIHHFKHSFIKFDFRFWFNILDSTFVLSPFITKPISSVTIDNASSCFCALSFSFSSKPMSSAYSRSLTFFSRILLDRRLCVVKSKSSMLAFLIITGKDSSLDGACERSIQIDDSNSNNQATSHRKSNKIPRKNKLPVNVILGNSIVKDVKGWKLSDDKNKVVVKHFSGDKTKDMESYIIPTLVQNPETIIIHSGTNGLKSDSSPEEIARDIIKLTTSCKTQTNKVILSSIVPRYGNLNEKATRVNKCLKKECEARNICFIDHRNISPKYNCNRSGLHLNYSGTRN